MRGVFISVLFIGLLYQCGIAQRSQNQIDIDEAGNYTIIRNGSPYFVKGAGADNPSLYRELAKRGGNSVRTWGISERTQMALDSAHKYGLSVLVGLWVQHETAGFNYDNETAVQNQLENFRGWVRRYKDHPAILGWGIGNEVNAGYVNLKVWNAIEDISLMVKEETNGQHLTTTVLAGTGQNLLNIVDERCPSLDFIGINLYGGIGAARSSVNNSNWNRPYMLTEWCVNGNWEVPRTEWGAPYEATSTEKASMFRRRYEEHVEANRGIILGSYAFLWNSKIEASQTWFGLWVRDQTTEMIDVLEYSWTGEWAENRAPKMSIVTLNGASQYSEVVIDRPDSNWVEVFATDLEDDPLSYEFLVQPWPNTIKTGLEEVPGATFKTIPEIVQNSDNNRVELVFSGEPNFRNYRLYIFVLDGHGHVATASYVFRVEIRNSGVEENSILPVQDAFVRDGAYESSRLGVSEEATLEVKKSGTPGFSREIFLSFRKEDLPQDADAYELVLQGSAPRDVEVELHTMEGAEWDEQSISWENKPQEWVSSGVVTTVGTTEQEYIWSMTEAIEHFLQSEANVLSLILTGVDTYTGEPATFASKESGINPPRIRYSISTSSMEEALADVFLYPNPVRNLVRIETEINFSGYQVIDLGGHIIRSGSFSKTLDLGNLSVGVYGLRFIFKDSYHSITKRIFRSE